jgi:hypothetical protein
MKAFSGSKLAATAFATLLTATAVTACSTGPGLSNGSVSVCYRAIPTARGATHDSKATLIGVHRIPVDLVRSRVPAAAQAEMAKEDDTVVCAVAFKGTFAAGQVDLAPVTQQGSYAVVLVTSRHLHLVGAVVLDHLPKSLGKRTI